MERVRPIRSLFVETRGFHAPRAEMRVLAPAPGLRPSMPDTIPADLTLTADSVRALAERSVRRESSASFQALLAAAVCSVRALADPIQDAEAAALNLRQRETVAGVRADLDALVAALGAGVSDQARCLDRRRPLDLARAVLRPAPGWLPRLRERAAEIAGDHDAPCPTWLAASAAAVEALGQTAEHLATLAAAQPPPSSARALGDRAADRLRAGRDALLADVARLVD